MTTFKEIRGTDILALSSDPANPELGQIWYNSSSGTLKGYVLANVNAWSSGGNLNTARYSSKGAGTQNATFATAGFTQTDTATGATENYNGTSWTNSGSLNTTRRGGGATGTQTAGLYFGGYIGPAFSNATESYNGSSWTNLPATMPISMSGFASFGTQTAVITAGGNVSPYAQTLSYNGTSWTQLPASINTARYGQGSSGIQTAGLIFGGAPNTTNPGVYANTESWNGSSWTSVNSMNTARANISGFGTQTAAIGAGGDTGNDGSKVATTESWNGTSWTATTSLSVARYASTSAGTQTAGIVAGGYPYSPPYGNATEEWTGQELQTRTVTVS
jgi:hypothetical protein